ncbi:MAG: SDR family oxidoreductase [Propionibacteriaceae bacterium]|nr:SDR family oxidoreductase [Propionibacteriaceae bacterium]
MSGPLAGRRAVVTGSSNGIGAAVARRLAADGADVVGVDVEPSAGDWETVLTDLADPDDVVGAAADLAAREPDILVNCAGIYLATPLAGLDLGVYHRLLAIDLHAPVQLISVLGTGMAERGWGRVVSITSVHADRGEPGALAYDIAKAGLEAATRVAAIELADGGVLVNAVAPGFVSTRMALVNGVDELTLPELRTIYLDHGRIPLRRPAAPQELSGLVSWLVSADNSYLTGASLRVDGGLSARL